MPNGRAALVRWQRESPRHCIGACFLCNSLYLCHPFMARSSPAIWCLHQIWQGACQTPNWVTVSHNRVIVSRTRVIEPPWAPTGTAVRLLVANCVHTSAMRHCVASCNGTALSACTNSQHIEALGTCCFKHAIGQLCCWWACCSPCCSRTALLLLFEPWGGKTPDLWGATPPRLPGWGGYFWLHLPLCSVSNCHSTEAAKACWLLATSCWQACRTDLISCTYVCAPVM